MERMGAGPEVVVMSIRVEVLCVNAAGSEPRREVLSIERSELERRIVYLLSVDGTKPFSPIEAFHLDVSS